MTQQSWAAYSTAQTSERERFESLLWGLVQNAPEDEQEIGRPRLDLRETLYCSILKVYSQMSQRRAHGLYKLEKKPHYNAVGKLLNREDVYEVLYGLLVLSALPLRAVEKDFAVDSSGFRTTCFTSYCQEKHKIKRKNRWLKAHILVGVKTNVIAAAEITTEYSNDSPQFRVLLDEGQAAGFNIQSVCADKAYGGTVNRETANARNIEAYIPFKKNARPDLQGALWKKMYHYFKFNEDEFNKNYHKRNNVETTFFMIKSKFGDLIRSKKWIAQRNELLCKLIAHNLVVLVHEMEELGIESES